MKKALSVLAVALLVAGIGWKIGQDPFFDRLQPANTTVSVRNTPAVAQGFFNALCDKDAKYLSAHSGGALEATEEELLAYFSRLTDRCTGVRYLGSLVSPAGYTQYVAVLAYAEGETWYVMTTDADGVAIGLE